jgi:hypothetical protein
MLIVNRIIFFLCYFNIVIQSLGSVGKGDIHDNRQNKTIKKWKEIDGVVVYYGFAVNMAMFDNINADVFTYSLSFLSPEWDVMY